MPKATVIRKEHLIAADLCFRGLVHYYHGGKHGSILADIVLKELRVLELQAAEGDHVPHCE